MESVTLTYDLIGTPTDWTPARINGLALDIYEDIREAGSLGVNLVLNLNEEPFPADLRAKVMERLAPAMAF